VDPQLPSALAEDIDFLENGTWVDFIIEYHREVKFQALLPARAPIYPVFVGDKRPGGGYKPPKPGRRPPTRKP
jgi:hypothetical protein